MGVDRPGGGAHHYEVISGKILNANRTGIPLNSTAPPLKIEPARFAICTRTWARIFIS
jgi:hypothetical protein